MFSVYLLLFFILLLQTATLEELKEAAYDHYNLHLSGIQLLVAQADQDWNEARKSASSPFHILSPVELRMMINKSISPKDTKLPK